MILRGPTNSQRNTMELTKFKLALSADEIGTRKMIMQFGNHGGRGQWIVGYAEEKGTSTGVFFTDNDAKCPHQTGYTWKYFVRAIESWIDAGKSMSIWSAI